MRPCLAVHQDGVRDRIAELMQITAEDRAVLPSCSASAVISTLDPFWLAPSANGGYGRPLDCERILALREVARPWRNRQACAGLWQGPSIKEWQPFG